MPEKYYKIPDKLWEQIKCLIPKEKSKPLGGRPPVSYRVVLAGIYYKLQTGYQWKAILPPYFGSGSTCHRKFQILVKNGAFEKMQ